MNNHQSPWGWRIAFLAVFVLFLVALGYTLWLLLGGL